VATPVIQLDWTALDDLREAKKKTPHSGTTAILAEDGRAIWFSKNILPALRKEAALRKKGALSPVYRHVGLYGFTRAALRKFTALPISRYEALEGLEQLRALEAGLIMRCAVVPPPEISTSGVDTPEDLERLNRLIAVSRQN
jgi:3-deoxy-manno-octulosonate cytidylyltransferase (CMP-KDO synthetase)